MNTEQLISELVKGQSLKLQFPITQRKAIVKEILQGYEHAGKNNFQVDIWKDKAGNIIDNYKFSEVIKQKGEKYENLSQAHNDSLFKKDQSKIDYLASKVEELIEKEGLQINKKTKERVAQPSISIANRLMSEFEPDAKADGTFVVRRRVGDLLGKAFDLGEVVMNVVPSYFDLEERERKLKAKELSVRDSLVHEFGFKDYYTLRTTLKGVELQNFEEKMEKELNKQAIIKADRDPIPFNAATQRKRIEEKYLEMAGTDSFTKLPLQDANRLQIQIENELSVLSRYTTEADEELHRQSEKQQSSSQPPKPVESTQPKAAIHSPFERTAY